MAAASGDMLRPAARRWVAGHLKRLPARLLAGLRVVIGFLVLRHRMEQPTAVVPTAAGPRPAGRS